MLLTVCHEAQPTRTRCGPCAGAMVGRKRKGLRHVACLEETGCFAVRNDQHNGIGEWVDVKRSDTTSGSGT